MRFMASAFLGLALLLFGDVSWGQTEAPPSQDQPLAEAEKEKRAYAWSQFFFEEFLLRRCDDPTLRSAIALPQPKLIVSVDEDEDAKVTGRIGLRIAERVVLNIEATSPRTSSEEETTLASLDGLSNGSSAELKLSWFGWGPKSYTIEKLTEDWCILTGGAERQENTPQWRAYNNMMGIICQSIKNEDPICKALHEKKSPKNSTTQTSKNVGDAEAKDSICIALKEKKSSKNADGQTNNNAETDQGNKTPTITDYMESPTERPSAIAMLGKDKYHETAEAYTEWLRRFDIFIPVLTFDAHAKNNEFKFFTRSAGPPAGLKETSEFHTDFDLVVSGGAYLWGRFYAAANYRRGNNYLDGAKQEFCTPVGPASILRCEKPPIAPPHRERSEALEFEVRGSAGRVGFGANVTRDLKANVTKIELPVFLLQKLGDLKMELNLGAKVEWNSDTKKFAFGVFAGPALSSVFRMFNRQNQS